MLTIRLVFVVVVGLLVLVLRVFKVSIVEGRGSVLYRLQ